MTGWAYFEGGYAGGVDTIATGTGTTREGLPSLTDTFFALEFLDGSNSVLAGSVEIELRANGQVNNPDITEATRNWLQHTLVGTAPAGTVSVRVRASMVDGEFNIDLPHQAAWVDDFSLTAIPEPTSLLMGLLGLGLAGAARRSRAA
jgi:MYXO-CTERM domain-containing protein